MVLRGMSIICVVFNVNMRAIMCVVFNVNMCAGVLKGVWGIKPVMMEIKPRVMEKRGNHATFDGN